MKMSKVELINYGICCFSLRFFRNIDNFYLTLSLPPIDPSNVIYPHLIPGFFCALTYFPPCAIIMLFSSKLPFM